MSRAQALLIIVGDPNVLSLDPLWRSFLSYIYNSGGWTGRPLPDWDTTTEIDNDEFIRRRKQRAAAEQEETLQKVIETIDKRSRTEDIDGTGDGYEGVERPWRELD